MVPDTAFLAAVQRSEGFRTHILPRLSKEQLEALNAHFPTYAHKGQIPPIANWRTWLIQAGRGFGKTRAGAEWVWSLVREGESNLHIALVAATIDEARRVMVEGPSGILALQRGDEIESWTPSQRQLRFRNGALATLYSGAQAEGLRGPEHHFAWCDEMAKWPQGEDAWMNLQLGMRAGERPRVLITTTPKPSALLRAIIDAPDTVVTGGPTITNPHLPKDFIAAMEARFAGTRIGRQELDGEMLDDVEGSLWPRALIERCRIKTPLPLAGGAGGGLVSSPDSPSPNPSRQREGLQILRTIVGVDPPASTNGMCGIVVCGRDALRRGFVLADCSLAGASPERWAAAVAQAARDWEADLVVAERNQGGDMVKSVLTAAREDLHIHLVHAAKGKVARAEPVATLFEKGEAFFAGRFPELETQLSAMQAAGGYAGPSTGLGNSSPDRADAMVWAMTALMLDPEKAPVRIRAI